MSFLDFGGMNDPFGSMGGMQSINQTPIGQMPPAHKTGTIGGPNTGGKSQSQGAPGQYLQGSPPIPNVAGVRGAPGTQGGKAQGLGRVPLDKLGFPQRLYSGERDELMKPIPTNQLDVMGGKFQKIGQGGSSVGEGMTQPLGPDLQQAQQGQQKLGFMDTLAQIESSGGTNTRNLISPSHTGKYQMSPAAFNRFSKGGDINDEASQHAAAENMVNYNRQQLGVLLGRNASDAEVYISYQQGLHGAWQLLSNPDKPAGSLVKPQHIQANGGNPRAPARQFIQTLTQKWDETAGGPSRGINPDAFAAPAQRFTNKGAQQTGSTEQLLRDMDRDAAAASQLRTPPDMGGMEGK